MPLYLNGDSECLFKVSHDAVECLSSDFDESSCPAYVVLTADFLHFHDSVLNPYHIVRIEYHAFAFRVREVDHLHPSFKQCRGEYAAFLICLHVEFCSQNAYFRCECLDNERL